MLGQRAVNEKSNTIKAIPHFIALLELASALVTIDAMRTEATIAQAIVDTRADCGHRAAGLSSQPSIRAHYLRADYYAKVAVLPYAAEKSIDA